MFVTMVTIYVYKIQITSSTNIISEIWYIKM